MDAMQCPNLRSTEADDATLGVLLEVEERSIPRGQNLLNDFIRRCGGLG
jgi:hypothetical protein